MNCDLLVSLLTFNVCARYCDVYVFGANDCNV